MTIAFQQYAARELRVWRFAEEELGKSMARYRLILTTGDEIRERAAGENRPFTAEEAAELREMLDEAQALKDRIDRALRLRERVYPKLELRAEEYARTH